MTNYTNKDHKFLQTQKAFTSIKSGFTLIELLVVISIIAILVGISIFGLNGARLSSRDARRKSDLELIRSGLELYKADCNSYPAAAPAAGANLVGTGVPTSCAASNVYITGFPADPVPASRSYRYTYTAATGTFTLCAALENAPSPAMDVTGCGSCTAACNYKVTNP